MEKEKNFKWMVYALLFLILFYVSKENLYIWLRASTWISEHTSLSEKLVIEDFRNYMKGE